MTNEDIDKMEAGPELDKLVNEKVFGIQLNEFDDITSIKPYSTDIAAAWEVVEKLKGDPIDSKIDWSWNPEISWLDGNRGWSVVLRGCEGVAPTVQLAICRAALSAVESSK